MSRRELHAATAELPDIMQATTHIITYEIIMFISEMNRVEADGF